MAMLARHSALGMFACFSLKEVGFALQGNKCHPREGVLNAADFGLLELQHQAVSAELNALVHCIPSIHANECNWEGLTDELLLNLNCSCDNVLDLDGCGRRVQVLIEQAREVTVQPFIAADQFTQDAQPQHEGQVMVAKPECGTEGTREEDSFNNSERNKVQRKWD